MKYNTIFVSDIHLGTTVSQTAKLLKFLKENEFDKLYLVGDIVDMTAIRRRYFYWDENHNTLLQKILRMARKGVQVEYIVGNHDIFLEFFIHDHFGNIKLKERDVHVTADGRKCLVMHGHQFDGVIKKLPLLYWLGDTMYDFALLVNMWFNRVRTLLGKDYWSLSLYLKTKVKNVMKFINNYEQLVIHEVKKDKNCDTVIVGHIHMAADKEISGIRYLNCGCWTEFCSAVVEHEDGRLELIMIGDRVTP
jgi:UDP-2,3-diacylglucosamine pyrophosphatase LpxH